jgi:hypothetical protein
MPYQASQMGFAKMPHVCIQGLGTGHAEKNAAQDQKTGVPVRKQKRDAVRRVEGQQYRRVLNDPPHAQRSNRQKPNRHDRAKYFPYASVPKG